jgi:hypothetical protein
MVWFAGLHHRCLALVCRRFEAALAVFARKFVSHLLAFRASIVRQLMAPESSRVSSRTHAPKASPKALGVADAPSTDPVTLFQARDMLRQQTAALFSQFSSVQQVFGEGGEALDAVSRSSTVSEADLEAALQACLPVVAGDVKEKVSGSVAMELCYDALS